MSKDNGKMSEIGIMDAVKANKMTSAEGLAAIAELNAIQTKFGFVNHHENVMINAIGDHRPLSMTANNAGHWFNNGGAEAVLKLLANVPPVESLPKTKSYEKAIANGDA